MSDWRKFQNEGCKFQAYFERQQDHDQPVARSILMKGNSEKSMASMRRKILICGLPGTGKTTLARPLASSLGAVWFNGDDVRQNLHKDLGFSITDRIEQAKRMGWLCDRVVEAGGIVLADFICPTPETREAFGEAFVIWVNRIGASRYEDTNKIFVAPVRCDVEINHTMTPSSAVHVALEAWRINNDRNFLRLLRSHSSRR